jgi:hypothetical protein
VDGQLNLSNRGCRETIDHSFFSIIANIARGRANMCFDAIKLMTTSKSSSEIGGPNGSADVSSHHRASVGTFAELSQTRCSFSFQEICLPLS